MYARLHLHPDGDQVNVKRRPRVVVPTLTFVALLLVPLAIFAAPAPAVPDDGPNSVSLTTNYGQSDIGQPLAVTLPDVGAPVVESSTNQTAASTDLAPPAVTLANSASMPTLLTDVTNAANTMAPKSYTGAKIAAVPIARPAARAPAVTLGETSANHQPT